MTLAGRRRPPSRVQVTGADHTDCDVTQMNMGDVVDIYPYEGVVKNHGSGAELSRFSFKSDVLLDEVQAGGRINLIIGRGLTDWAREVQSLAPSAVFQRPAPTTDSGKGFTLAQKMVGKACGVAGVRPGIYCEPKMTTVGSQDTTGPMTRDELKDFACLGLSADLAMQSFCHTAAYPKPVDVQTHHDLGVVLQMWTSSQLKINKSNCYENSYPRQGRYRITFNPDQSP